MRGLLHDSSHRTRKHRAILKVTAAELESLERSYPGIREQILGFEEASVPACSCCGSSDTAEVQVGVIGRTINIAYATTRVKLIGSAPKLGPYFCHVCDDFFA